MNNKDILKHTEMITVIAFFVSIGVYELARFINGNYLPSEQPGLFQAIYALLAFLALGCLVVEIIFVKKNKELIWKIVSVIFSLFSLYVVLICLLGIASVNFFG